MIRIYAAWGGTYGSGHRVRMERLLALLKLQYCNPALLHLSCSTSFTSDVDTLHAQGHGENQEIIPLRILDARDFDPGCLPGSGPILAIDNRHPCREFFEESQDVIYFDSLPYPGSDYHAAMDNFLMAPEVLLHSDRKPLPHAGQLLFYAGALQDTRELDGILHELLRRGRLSRVIRLGPIPRTSADCDAIDYSERMSSNELYETMQSSEYVLSYFGVTLFEAWYLGSKPILYSYPSEYHSKLAHYLRRESQMPYVGTATAPIIPERWEEILCSENTQLSHRPGDGGYRKLMHLIENIMSKYPQSRFS